MKRTPRYVASITAQPRFLAILANVIIRTALFSCLLASTVQAGVLEREAAGTWAKYCAMMKAFRTVRYEISSGDAGTASSGVGSPVERRRVVWDNGKGKLKHSTLNSPPSAYVVSRKDGAVVYWNGSSTTYTDRLAGATVDGMSVGFPGWLWKPEWLLPAGSYGVREEGGIIVLVSGAKHPIREVRMDRATGLLAGFTDTDATGAVMRVVVCRNWHGPVGAKVPEVIEEEFRGAKKTVRRVTRLESVVINGAVDEAEFNLP